MNKKLFGSAVIVAMVVATFFVPVLASAQTSTSSLTISQLEAQIQALLSQLTTLRQQLGQVVGLGTHPTESSGTPPWANGSTTSPVMGTGSSTHPGLPVGIFCIELSRNLSEGSQGSDVSNLQNMLSQDPSIYPQGSVSGYFGPLTAQAVIRFQNKYGISSSPTGFVGPLTRKFFGNRCPGMVNTSTPPISPWMGTSTPPGIPQTWTDATGTLPRPVQVPPPTLPTNGSALPPPPWTGTSTPPQTWTGATGTPPRPIPVLPPPPPTGSSTNGFTTPPKPPIGPPSTASGSMGRIPPPTPPVSPPPPTVSW